MGASALLQVSPARAEAEVVDTAVDSVVSAVKVCCHCVMCLCSEHARTMTISMPQRLRVQPSCYWSPMPPIERRCSSLAVV